VEIKKEVLVEKVVGYICDVCSKSCNRETLTGGTNGATGLPSPDEEQHEWATLHAHWGYWSDGKDTQEHMCYMCEECYDKVRYYIEVVLGGKVNIDHYM